MLPTQSTITKPPLEYYYHAEIDIHELRYLEGTTRAVDASAEYIKKFYRMTEPVQLLVDVCEVDSLFPMYRAIPMVLRCRRECPGPRPPIYFAMVYSEKLHNYQAAFVRNIHTIKRSDRFCNTQNREGAIEWLMLTKRNLERHTA